MGIAFPRIGSATSSTTRSQTLIAIAFSNLVRQSITSTRSSSRAMSIFHGASRGEDWRTELSNRLTFGAHN
jgi:hypothetical protein